MFGDLIRTKDPPSDYQVPPSNKDYRSGHCEACKGFINGSETPYVETFRGGIAHERCSCKFCKSCKSSLADGLCMNELCSQYGKPLIKDQFHYAAVHPTFQSDEIALADVAKMITNWEKFGVIQS